MNRVIKLFLIYLFLTVSEILPQGHISFKHLTVEDGLSQSSVTCILQDKNGFMWFGTQDGLNRFDGYKFRVFKNIPEDSTSLTDNFVYSMYESKSGVLYIETQSMTLHRYNPRDEAFAVVNKDSVDLRQAKISTVGALLREPSGIEWTGGLSKKTGLIRKDTKTGKTETFKNNPSDPQSISDDKVYSIFRDRSGNLWIGTFSGLDRLNEKTGKFIHYRNDPKDPNSLPANWVWPIYEDSRGHLLIGTVNGGLSEFNPRTNNFTNYKNDPNDPTSINDNFIFSIYEDRNSVIWVGTNLGGINYYNPATRAFNHFKNDPENSNSLNDNIVSSMLADREGNYWIGTRNGGLNKYNFSANKFTSYQHNPTKPNSVLSNSIQSLYEDKSGIIWIGTFSNGLSAFNPATGLFKNYVNNPADQSTLTDNRIYSLLEDTFGNLWIGTYGGGLNRLERQTGKFTSYQFKAGNPNSVSSNATWSVENGKPGEIWIGTFGGGVDVYNIKNNSFIHYKNIPGDSTSLIDNNIIRVFRDSKGRMWFGSTKGLSKFIGSSGTFKNYTEKEGLSNSSVYGITEDKKGNLWLSTNNGLSNFDPQSETFKNYYYEDGLQGNEFNQNAFAKDNITGNLLFGGPNGFNVFNPDSIKANTNPPAVAFTGYLRYNTDDEEGRPIVENGITERDSIFLTYKDNIITLDFSALSYYNNLENEYKYKLEGFNENWIQLGNKRSVTFTNLSAGDYKLRVAGSNSDGVWNDEGASLLVFVSPPWWKTNIAYGIYGVIFISILLSIRKFEADRREQKAKIRETELRMKATEAEKRAIQIENDRKTKELEEARQLQLSMLPKELPVLPDLEIAAFMRTATEVGGDYYDFIVMQDGVLNVAFGDATGHGLQAGTMVTLMKGFFTSDSSRLGQTEFMNHCTQMIKEIKLGRILMSFSFLRIHNGVMSVTSAGMPPVYHFNTKTNETEEITVKGMPLGAKKNFPYKLIEKDISPGDTILLLSDGLPEQMNSAEEMFDYPRVKEKFNLLAAESPNTIIEKLVEAADSWMNGRIQDDDITLVVIKVK